MELMPGSTDTDWITKMESKDVDRRRTKNLEIQDHNSVGGRILECKTFYGYNVTDVEKNIHDVGGDSGVCIVDFGDELAHTKIEVICWETLRPKEKRKIHKPLTCLIYANGEGDARLKLMEKVIYFARKTKLPCHIVGQRVLLSCDSTDIAFIHYKTDKVIVMELVKNGFRRFERVDINGSSKPGNEMDYFKGITEYFFGLYVKPVVIPLGHRWKSQQMQLPIIRLKRDNSDVSVLWPEDDQSFSEYTADVKSQWHLKKTKPVMDDFPSDDVISENWCDFDILVCRLLIRVYMDKKLAEGRNKGIHVCYYTALLMYLLKKGEWNIPKKYIKRPVHLRSALEYILEEDYECINYIWLNKKYVSAMDYKLHEHKGQEANLKILDDECYGLVFLALLQKQYWIGAKKLVDLEYVENRQILVGCAILEDEQLHLKKAFTERVICIIRHIDDAADKNESKKIVKIEENKIEERELGVAINHAGRLLLNHGYLTDAINSKNKNFVENWKVKKILNKMWYGKNNIDKQSIFCFIVLGLVHPLVMPLLMVNMEMENRLLLWFYKKYKLPIMKIFIHSLGVSFLLFAYAYMLLFDYKEDGITYSDCIMITWMASYFVNETKQVIVALIRDKIGSYVSDWWNIVDCMVVIGYSSGMLLRAAEGSGFRITSKCLLVAVFMLLCLRLLSLFCIIEFLGSKLVIIRIMIKHTIAFMVIMSVIIFWYSVSFYAFLYPNSEVSWKQFETILSNGYWILFGELNLDRDTLTVPDCTFNRTIYESGALQRCPTQLGLYITPYFKAFYAYIAVVILLNLLIAMYSNIFEDVHTKSRFYWSELQISFLEEYSIQTIFPIHLQLLALPGTIFALLWLCCVNLRQKNSDEHDRTKEFNHHPSFVRVFLFDSNYDLKLKSTEEEEKNAQTERGKIEIVDVNTVTITSRPNNPEDSLSEFKDMTKMIIDRLEKIEDSIKEFKDMTKTLYVANIKQKSVELSEEGGIYNEMASSKDS